MVLINSDVVARGFFASPIDGVPEMIEMSIVGIVFLQIGDATRNGRLTRSDGFFQRILARYPTFGRYYGAAFDLLGAIFMFLIIIGSVPLLIEAYENDYYVGNEGIFTAPVWPIKTIILIGCGVTMTQFLIFTWNYLFVKPQKSMN
ncbi:MAG: TRAP transporter small permease subunit [SAR324 cluster bacterium]|nr:TRAP transporter small permease subunit [SAR324 cluster bacterium]